MALIGLAVAGGGAYLGWKSATIITRWALMTVFVSIVYDTFLMPETDYGAGDLVISATIAGLLTGVLS